MSTETVNLQELSDTELREAHTKAFANYMYYQCAERNWSQETEGRNKADAYLDQVNAEIKRRDIPLEDPNGILRNVVMFR